MSARRLTRDEREAEACAVDPRLEGYARLLNDLREGDTERRPEPTRGDHLIDECEDCGQEGYMCVCDWLNTGSQEREE